jgi:hypothetical protein
MDCKSSCPPTTRRRCYTRSDPERQQASSSSSAYDRRFCRSLGEIGGGFLIASGLLTPLGTALVAAAMTTAILSVHIGKGIWNADGGIEFPLVILTSLSRERARAGLVLDRLLGRHRELDRHPLGRR